MSTPVDRLANLAPVVSIKHATGIYTIDTSRLPDLPYLIEYALGVIVQRAPAGLKDDAAKSRAAIETRIDSLYNGRVKQNAVAVEMLKGALTAKGTAIPKGDDWKTMLAKFSEKYADKIAAEIARRASVEDLDLDL